MKKQAFSATGIFVALVLSFAAWTYFSEYKGLEKETAEKEKSAALLPFSNSKVVSFSLKDFDKTAPFDETFLRKDGEQWKLEKPMTDLGDPAAVESFLGSLSTQKIKEVVVEAPDIAWSTFGLDRPQIEAQFVALDGGTEVKRKITIGSVPAFDGSVYGRLDGEQRVLLFESAVEAILLKEARAFRDKRFFPGEKHPEFAKAEIKVRGQKIEFEKTKDVWALARGRDEWPLDSKKVQEWIESISGLRANDIWAEDNTDPIVIRGRKLNAPAFEARLTGSKAEVYEVKIAALAKEESVAAATGSQRPLVFSLNRNVIESLLKSIDDVRDLKFPFSFGSTDKEVKLNDVVRIEIERPKGQPRLPAFLRDGKTWKLDEASGKEFVGRKIKQDSLDQFIVSTTGLSARKVVGKSALKFGAKKDEKGFGVKFKTADGKSALELMFVEGDNPAVLHASSSKAKGYVFEFDRSILESIPLELLEPVANEKGKP